MSTERLIYTGADFRGTLDDTGIKLLTQSLQAPDSSCFPACLPSKSHNWIENSHIPYTHIIWTETKEENIVNVTYVYPQAKTIATDVVAVEIDGTDHAASTILAKAYPHLGPAPSLLVLINPHGGQGEAKSIYKHKIDPIFKAAHASVEYIETEYSGHATEVARQVDVAKYDVVVCCSGDGIPHEVINGFYQRQDSLVFDQVAVSQLPCGSGNALSLSTHGSNDAAIAAFKMLKLKPTKLDVMAVTQGVGDAEVTKLSFLSQCYGIIADSDIGTEHLRWMGPVRFELGVAQKILARAKYPCDIWVDYATQSKQEIEHHFVAHRTGQTQTPSSPTKLTAPKLNEEVPLSWVKIDSDRTDNLNVLYVGKMPYVSSDTQFFPAALPNDGTMDMIVTDAQASLLQSFKVLVSVENGSHVHIDEVHHAKIRAYRLVPKIELKGHYISVDGENFPFEPLQVEVMPGLLTGLLQDGSFVDTCFSV